MAEEERGEELTPEEEEAEELLLEQLAEQVEELERSARRGRREQGELRLSDKELAELFVKAVETVERVNALYRSFAMPSEDIDALRRAATVLALRLAREITRRMSK